MSPEMAALEKAGYAALKLRFAPMFFGLFSFFFMFMTNRSQGVHDLIAGAEVRIRDPQIALETDYFVPRLPGCHSIEK